MKMYGNPQQALVVLLLCALVAMAGCSGGDSSGTGSSEEGQKAAPSASGAAGSGDATDMSDVALVKLDGTKTSVRDYEGKIMFITFLATWHADSQKIIPILNEIHRKYNKNVRVMVVAMDKQGPATVRSYFAGSEPAFDIFFDRGSTANRFGGARVMPTTYILHRDGKFFHRIDGLQRKDRYEKIILSMYKQRF